MVTIGILVLGALLIFKGYVAVGIAVLLLGLAKSVLT